MNMFHRCDMGMAGRVWPDGGTPDQPTKLVRAFSVISSAVSKARKPNDQREAAATGLVRFASISEMQSSEPKAPRLSPPIEHRRAQSWVSVRIWRAPVSGVSVLRWAPVLISGRTAGSTATGRKGFSASGWIYTRSRSERSLGALKIYSEGGDILPCHRQVGVDSDQKRTQAHWSLSYHARTLFEIQPRLEHRPTGIPARTPSRRSAACRQERQHAQRAIPIHAACPEVAVHAAGREAHDFIVMFIGIKRTSRAQRFSPSIVTVSSSPKLPSYWYQAMGEQ